MIHQEHVCVCVVYVYVHKLCTYKQTYFYTYVQIYAPREYFHCGKN